MTTKPKPKPKLKIGDTYNGWLIGALHGNYRATQYGVGLNHPDIEALKRMIDVKNEQLAKSPFWRDPRWP